MTERSRFWDGTTVGDATEAPYDASTEFAKVMASLAGSDQLANYGGVFSGVLNELAVTGTATPVAVATGRALVWGGWYESDAIVNVVIPTPAGATRIDYIVARKSWAAQTIRITRIAGAEGGAAPALVQNAGTTWDIPLATVSITTGGVITVTDAREFLHEPPDPVALTVVAITSADSPYTVPGWNYLVLANATGGAITVNLPTAVGFGGRQIDVRKGDSSANAVTVDGNGGETINGAATKVLNVQYVDYTFRSDGTNVVIT